MMPHEGLPTEMISLRELSRRTGIGLKTLRKLRDNQGLPVYRIGKRRQTVIASEWWEWVRSHRLPIPLGVD